MGHMGSVFVAPMFVACKMCRRILVNRTNVFSWLMTQTISSRWCPGVMWFNSEIETMRMRFVGFTPRGCFAKPFLAPESQSHESSHIERRTGCGDCAYYPDEPAERNVSGGCRPP